MRISDWSSDVCSSDLRVEAVEGEVDEPEPEDVHHDATELHSPAHEHGRSRSEGGAEQHEHRCAGLTNAGRGTAPLPGVRLRERFGERGHQILLAFEVPFPARSRWATTYRAQ